jgi:hypothetical protein
LERKAVSGNADIVVDRQVNVDIKYSANQSRAIMKKRVREEGE